MTLTYYFMLILFPVSSWTFSCHYNDSAVVLRKTVLLELEDHAYIHIYDANFDIKPKNNTSESTSLANRNLHLIENISFKGYIMQGDERKYIEVTLDNLKSYRYMKHDKVCRVSYQETKGHRFNITSEQEAAIIRLAESCIQSTVCGIDLMEVDVDSDLYYQSTQSSLNELVDFYIPKLLDSLLDNDKNLKTPEAAISTDKVSFSAKRGIIKGINTLQRANDVVVKHEKSKYNISIVARFSELNIFLYDIKANYRFIKTSGNLEAMFHGISLKTNVIIDLQLPTCTVTLDNIELMAFKNIKLQLPLWGWFTISYNLSSDNLWFFENAILSYIIRSIPAFNFDCKKYLDEISKVIS